MSYEISIVDKNNKVIILDEPFLDRGGTYQIEGSYEAEFNITYNYSEIIKKVSEYSINDLDGKKVKNTLGYILNVIIKLKEDDKTNNYWDATEYNTKKALVSLLNLGIKAPDGYREIS